jgi:hypothetical protein
MSDPWAFPDEPPPRRVGLAIGIVLATVTGLVVFLMVLVVVAAR